MEREGKRRGGRAGVKSEGKGMGEEGRKEGEGRRIISGYATGSRRQFVFAS